jgi:hypothetical protein
VQRYIDSLQLSGRWWWASVAALLLVVLIFLAAGSAAAALICLAFALAIVALTLRARSSDSSDQA